MIAIAALAMTVFHPGWCFPQLSKGHKKYEEASDDSVELSGRGSEKSGVNGTPRAG
jgi:hypothetical protein